MQALLSMTKGQKMNTVLSDMAPNMSGQLTVDQPKSMYLAELALDMAIKILTPNGHFLVKVFQGDGFDSYVQIARQNFKNDSNHKSPGLLAPDLKKFIY